MSDMDKAVEAVYNSGKVTLASNKVKLTGYGNLRAFLNELHDFLVKSDFVDVFTPGFRTPRGQKYGGGDVMLKKGEFTDAGDYHNRTSDMYEKEFRDVDLGGGAKEYEVIWHAVGPLKLSYFGDCSFRFEFKVVNRRCDTKEFEEDGKKIEKQGGTWEFESKYIYINDVSYKLNNIPVIGHWNWTRELYYKKFFGKFVEKDIIDGMKMTAKLRAIPVKYFSLLK